MPYTVLRVSKAIADRTEVLGEFPNEREARDFAEDAEREDLSHKDEYLVERPPPPSEKNLAH